MEEMLDRYLADDKRTLKERVVVVPGGTDRNETLMNVIDRIEARYGEAEEHILVTHDAVRPFVTNELIERHIEAALRYGAVDTVIPAVDTIVVSEDGETIDSIPNRASLYQSQTPQSFRMSLLRQFYASLRDEEKKILTDACKICVVRNYPVHLVAGSPLNFKVTTPDDYRLAKLLAEQTEDK
jgi:2-C-methyl-D-erythritol 4-phosphate cytidylyltransferase